MIPPVDPAAVEQLANAAELAEWYQTAATLRALSSALTDTQRRMKWAEGMLADVMSRTADERCAFVLAALTTAQEQAETAICCAYEAGWREGWHQRDAKCWTAAPNARAHYEAHKPERTT